MNEEKRMTEEALENVKGGEIYTEPHEDYPEDPQCRECRNFWIKEDLDLSASICRENCRNCRGNCFVARYGR